MKAIMMDREILDIVYESYNKGLSYHLLKDNQRRYNRSYGLHRFLQIDSIMGSWSDRTWK